MKRAALALVRAALAALYALVKACTHPRPHKVVFLSRRMAGVPLDFALLIEELRRRMPETEVVVLSMLARGGVSETLRFVPLLLRSLVHLATAKVCVLDSYWPAVSMLRHRESLVVYQLWHSLGKVKQSGRQAIDRAQGRSALVAEGMRMHEGYDFVVAGAEVWNPQYCASFGVRPEQLLNFGLPRADYLLGRREEIEQRVRARYPELNEKPVVLYVPTLRRGRRAEGALLLAEALDLDRFTLVVKKHPSDELLMPTAAHLTCPEFQGSELLTVADYVVTDFSSIALEAALLDAKTLYFLYDAEDYLRGNGVNIDLAAQMPGCVFTEAAEVQSALEREYPREVLRRYRERFVLREPGRSTAHLAEHILSVGALCPR